MRNASTKRAALALSLLLPFTAARADQIFKTDGDKPYGQIVSSTKGSMITFRTTAGSITLPKNKIARIEDEPPAVDHQRLGDQHMKLNKYAEAEAEYRQALALDANLA